MTDRKHLLQKQPTKLKSAKKYILWRRTLLVIISLVLGINVYRWNAVTLAGNALPMPFGWGCAVVMSGSMQPALYENDIAVIHEAENYQVGDIVIYQSGRSLVIHRITEIQGDTAILQGDANNAPDAPISVSAIKGRLAFSVPKIGRVVRMAKTAPGIMIVMVAFLLIEQSWRKQKHIEQENLNELEQQIQHLREKLDQDALCQNDSSEDR